MNKSLLIKSLIVIGVMTYSLTGCTDTARAHYSALGNEATITLYSATGVPIKQWKSTGKVQNAGQSDGYEFKDAATGNLIQVTGTVVVEQKT